MRLRSAQSCCHGPLAETNTVPWQPSVPTCTSSRSKRKSTLRVRPSTALLYVLEISTVSECSDLSGDLVAGARRHSQSNHVIISTALAAAAARCSAAHLWAPERPPPQVTNEVTNVASAAWRPVGAACSSGNGCLGTWSGQRPLLWPAANCCMRCIWHQQSVSSHCSHDKTAWSNQRCTGHARSGCYLRVGHEHCHWHLAGSSCACLIVGGNACTSVAEDACRNSAGSVRWRWFGQMDAPLAACPCIRLQPCYRNGVLLWHSSTGVCIPLRRRDAFDLWAPSGAGAQMGGGEGAGAS
jgi:hypothetical protein